MKQKETSARDKELKKAMEFFPREIRRQELAHREEMRIKRAFGRLSLDDLEKSEVVPEGKVRALYERLKK